MGTKFGGTEWKLRGQIAEQRDVRSKTGNDERDCDRKVNGMFKDFLANLVPGERWNNEIDRGRSVIERALSKELYIRGVHMIGSYARDTLIKGRKGVLVDMMLILDKARHGDWLRRANGPSICLGHIKERLIKSPEFHDADVDGGRNSVTVRFGKFKFNIVPAFRTERGYSISDPTGLQDWISTDPRVFNKVVGRLDRRFKGRVKEMIRIVKGWNDANGGLLQSFHIENMVYLHFKDRPSNIVSSLQEDVLNFYARLPTYLQNPTAEPVNGDRIDSYLGHGRSKAIDRAQRSVDRLVQAEDLKRRGRLDQALEQYKKVFGTEFSQ